MVAVRTLCRHHPLRWREEQARRRWPRCEVGAIDSRRRGNKEPRQTGNREDALPPTVVPWIRVGYPGARSVAGWGAEPWGGSSFGAFASIVLPAQTFDGAAG